MTERELIDALCDVRLEWGSRRDALHRSGLYHVDGAHLGCELLGAILERRDEPWMHQAFRIIEQALVDGTKSTWDLVVTGLFEAMQNVAYAQAEPPDIIDGWFGPVSLRTWADLIEGWQGGGIRSIEAWRAQGQ